MNLKKKLLNFKKMLFNKKFVLLLSFIFIPLSFVAVISVVLFTNQPKDERPLSEGSSPPSGKTQVDDKIINAEWLKTHISKSSLDVRYINKFLGILALEI